MQRTRSRNAARPLFFCRHLSHPILPILPTPLSPMHNSIDPIDGAGTIVTSPRGQKAESEGGGARADQAKSGISEERYKVQSHRTAKAIFLS